MADQPEAEIKQMQAEIERLSKLVYYDELTGILNRRGFLEEVGKVFYTLSFGTSTVERRVNTQIPFSVIFADIDNFKNINDTYGHDAGDDALRMIAGALKKSLRSGDYIGRMGGEEFVVAVVGAPAGSAEPIAEKLRASVAKLQLVRGAIRVPLTASFGVADYSSEATLTDVIAKADRAMYLAKEAGKNRVVIAR